MLIDVKVLSISNGGGWQEEELKSVSADLCLRLFAGPWGFSGRYRRVGNCPIRLRRWVGRFSMVNSRGWQYVGREVSVSRLGGWLGG